MQRLDRQTEAFRRLEAEVRKHRHGSVSSVGSKMSDFKFSNVLAEPKTELFEVPRLVDRDRIDSIVSLLQKYRAEER